MTTSVTYDVLGNASVTTPTATPTFLSLHNESKKGEEENEVQPFDRDETSKKKYGVPVIVFLIISKNSLIIFLWNKNGLYFQV